MSDGPPICAWCGTPIVRTTDRGPVPRYCSAAHRQLAFRARHATTEQKVERGWQQRAALAEADADRLAARLAKVVQHFRCLDDEWAALAAHDEAVKARV